MQKSKLNLVLKSILIVFAPFSFGFSSEKKMRQDIVDVCLAENFPCSILISVCSRESDFGRTLDKNMKGDKGFGHGVFQIDSRSHSAWLKSHNWRDTKVSAKYAVSLLKANLKRFKGNWRASIAAYNCGGGNIKDLMNPDARTTGKNYSFDVMKRTRKFKVTFRTIPDCEARFAKN